MATSYGRVEKGTGPEIPVLEDGYYEAQVIDVEDSVNTYAEEKQPQYQVKFELDADEDGKAIVLMGWIRIPDGVINDGVLNENSRLYEFLQALGYSDEEMVIDPSAWQGERLRLHVKNKEIKEGQNKGQVRPRIVNYAPLGKQGPRQAAGRTQPARESMAAGRARPAREPVAAGRRQATDDQDNF